MTLRSLLVLILTLTFGAAPFLTPPFTGYPPDIFPVQIDRPAIQPAGYAFAIWSVIYLWLITHAIFGFWKRAKSLDWDETRLPLATALALGTVWLWIAPHFPLLATLVILVMMVAALAAFLAADEFYDRWLLSAPLAIFAGWLSAAASVSVGILLAGYGILGNFDAAIAMLVVILGLASLVQYLRPEMPVYGLTVIWALIGIVMVNLRDQIIVSAAAGGAAFVIGSLLVWQRRKRAH